MSNAARFSPEDLKNRLEQVGSRGYLENSPDNLRLMFSLIDLTSLNTHDTPGGIKELCRRINEFPEKFPATPNIGAICVYPSLVPAVSENLRVQGVGIASVGAGFPSSQTFLPVKELECRMAVEAGATEIDIVISVGRYLENDLEFVSREISRIKQIVAPAKLKVILETGLLPGPSDIYKASLASLQAGADFIKTSTGKIQPAATPESVLVMCQAIKDHHEDTGIMSGIKPAGGISTAEQALSYAGIIRSVLGEEWLDPAFFRIGASRLANHILTEIARLEGESSDPVDYF